MVLIDLGEDILFAEIQSAGATTTTTTLNSSNNSVLLNPSLVSGEVIGNEDQRESIIENYSVIEASTSPTLLGIPHLAATMGNHGTKTHPLGYQLVNSNSNKGSNSNGASSSSSSDPSNSNNHILDTTNTKRVVSVGIPLLTTTTLTTNANANANEGGGFEHVKRRGPRETPDLYVYASYRNWELAKKQIELNRGLDYISTNRRFSVLHVAVENNAPVEIIKMLLDKGMDPNVVDTLFRQSPLHILMKILNDGGNAFEIMRALIDRGANVNGQAKYGRTPLYCAIKYRVSEPSVVFLLKSGALISPEELIFAREKSSRSMALLLEKVSIMTAICSSHLQRCMRRRSDGTVLVGRSTHLSILPAELFRELKRFLYR